MVRNASVCGGWGGGGLRLCTCLLDGSRIGFLRKVIVAP